MLDCCEGGNLKKLLHTRSVTEHEAALIMKQIFSALSYMHSNDIVHRGIQPGHILFETANDMFSVKICGFTNAVQLKAHGELHEEIKLVCS